MLLASVAVLVVVLAGVLFVAATRAAFATDRALLTAERAARRQRAWTVDRQLFLATRTKIADGVQTGTDAVAFTSSLTRAGHKALAAIPFGIMRAIPQTREAGVRAKAVHDEKAAKVYDSIESFSNRVAEGMRRRMIGEAEAVALESGLDETKLIELDGWDVYHPED